MRGKRHSAFEGKNFSRFYLTNKCFFAKFSKMAIAPEIALLRTRLEVRKLNCRKLLLPGDITYTCKALGNL